MVKSKLLVICFLIIMLVIGVTIFFTFPAYEIKGFEKALEGILLLSSISLGFYGACLSVLASIFNTKIVREIMDDNEYRKEFILIACSSLIIGFVLVITTIVYQVLLEYEDATKTTMSIINSVWFSTLFIFIVFSMLFILITFTIFLKNDSGEEQTTKTNPGIINNDKF